MRRKRLSAAADKAAAALALMRDIGGLLSTADEHAGRHTGAVVREELEAAGVLAVEEAPIEALANEGGKFLNLLADEVWERAMASAAVEGDP